MTEMTRLNPGSPVLQEYVCQACSEEITKVEKNYMFIGGSKNVACNYCGEKKDWMLTNYYADNT